MSDRMRFGSICTVPEVGAGTLCVVVSDVRGLKRGRPEYQVVPVTGIARAQYHDEFVIHDGESTLDRKLVLALWNLRPLREADLGQEVGRITDDGALNDLRDACLSLVDPSIATPANRLGKSVAEGLEPSARDREIDRWQPLSARVFARDRTVRVQIRINEASKVFTPTQLLGLEGMVNRAEELLSPAHVLMSGPDRSEILISFTIPATYPVWPAGIHPTTGAMYGAEFIAESRAVAERVMIETGEFPAVEALGEAA